MRFERKCQICGETFIAHNRNKKTCSSECSQELRKRYHASWIERHPDYMRDYFIENRERYSRTERRKRKEAREETSRQIGSVCDNLGNDKSGLDPKTRKIVRETLSEKYALADN